MLFLVILYIIAKAFIIIRGGNNMVGLVSALVGEIAYEVVRFVIMLALLVLAVFVGGKLRKAADAKKAAKMAASENKEKEITE